MSTDGECLKNPDAKLSDDSDKGHVSDVTLENILKGITKLQTSDVFNLRLITEFIYDNNLQKLSAKFRNQRNEIYDFLQFVEPFIKGLADTSRIKDSQNRKIFRVIISEYKTDKEFIEALSKVNTKQFETLDIEKIQMALEKVTSVYNSDNILLNHLDILLDEKIDNQEIKDIIHQTGDVTKEDVINAAANPSDFGITDLSSIETLNDNSLTFVQNIFKNLKEKIFAIENNIVETEKIFKDDFYINEKLVISFSNCIDKWKSFIESELYRSDLFGK